MKLPRDDVKKMNTASRSGREDTLMYVCLRNLTEINKMNVNLDLIMANKL